MHDLSETEANRLLTRLQEISVSAEKIKQADGKWSLAVEQEQSITALRFLEQTRLVRDKHAEADSKSALITSREDQRFKYERALSHAIEQTLLQVDSVLEARVHLNLPAVDPLFGRVIDESKTSSAGVLVIAQESSSLSEAKISELVSGASGVPVEKIKAVVTFEKLDSAAQPKVEVTVLNKASTEILANSQVLSVAVVALSLLGILLLYRGFSRRRVSRAW